MTERPLVDLADAERQVQEYRKLLGDLSDGAVKRDLAMLCDKMNVLLRATRRLSREVAAYMVVRYGGSMDNAQFRILKSEGLTDTGSAPQRPEPEK